MKYLVIALLFISSSVLSQTVLVKDINGGTASSTPIRLTNVNGTLFFVADDGSNGSELWISDGTELGTTLVKNIRPGGQDGGVIGITNVNGTAFFRADDGTTKSELWKSDGTLSGTVLVKDINPGGPSFASGVEYDNVFIFSAQDATNNRELWRSNGVEANTVKIAEINSVGESRPAEFTELNDELFFRANDGVNGIELWKTDGTFGGESLVLDINPTIGQSSTPSGLTVSNGQLFFFAEDVTGNEELWVSTGTGGGTSMVQEINPSTSIGSTPSNATDVNGTLFFSANNGTNGNELWVSDGTALGTSMVLDINPSGDSNPSNLYNRNGVCYFWANDGVNGIELWKSDGTPAGTSMVSDINLSGDAIPSYFHTFIEVDELLYFPAQDGVNGFELWRTDGTANGTIMVENINPGNSSSNPAQFAKIDGTLYFQATDGTNGSELRSYTPVTIQSSNIQINNVTDTNADIDWDNGNVSRRIVVMREGFPVNRTPVNGIDYSDGGNFFGSGSNLGNSNYVVYDGSGDNFTVSGLTPSSTYHVAIYDYIGSGAEIIYSTVGFPTGSFVTLSTFEPTVSASAIMFSNVQDDRMTVSWTGGNGANNILVASETAIASLPLDGIDYADGGLVFELGSDLGSLNYVVYDNDLNTATVTGLRAGTEYFYAVFEYNGSSNLTNYLTSAFPENSQMTTGVSEPTENPASISFSNIDFDRVDVNWTGGNGSNTLIVAREASISRLPTDGIAYPDGGNVFGEGGNLSGKHWVVFNGSSNSFTLTGLEANTTYFIAAFEFNGSGPNINYLTTSFPTNSVVTLAAAEPTTAASSISFGTTTTNRIDVSWTGGDGDRNVLIARESSAVSQFPIDGIDYADGGQVFAIGDDLGSNNFVVYDGTDNFATITGLNDGTEYHFAVLEYNGTGVETNYLTSAFPSNSQFTTGDSEPTQNPTNISFSNVMDNQMDIHWTGGNGTRTVVIARQSASISRQPVDGIDYPDGGNIFGAGGNLGGQHYIVFDELSSTNSFTLTGLTSNTTYHFAVFEYNGIGSAINYLTSTFFSNTQTTTGASSRSVRFSNEPETTGNTKSSLELSLATGLVMFPNPAINSISYYFKDALKIEFYTVDGSIVFTSNLNEDNGNIDISTWRRGVYLVRVISNSGNSELSRVILK